MKFRFLLTIATILISGHMFAQTTTDEQVQTRSKQLLKQDVSQYVNEEAYHLPWERIMEKDVLWAKTVVRTIDMNAPANQALNSEKILFNTLIEGALGGKIKLYDSTNDRFMNTLSKEGILALVAPGHNKKAIKPSSISKYRVKEQWLFTNQGKMTVRIIGLAPLTTEGKPLFWAYFPNCREYLAQVTTTTGKNWDEILSNREFTSTIEKVKGDTRAQKLENE